MLRVPGGTAPTPLSPTLVTVLATAAVVRTRLRVVPVLLLVAAANALVVGLVHVGHPELLVLLAVGVPTVAAVIDRPQRGLLLLATLAPFNGLLVLTPGIGVLAGWKEALTLLTLGATFVAPAPSRGAQDRRLPGWAAAVGGLAVLSIASAVVVGGLQAAVGLKIGFFYVLAGVAAWRCPLDARERDHLVSIIMGVGVVTAAVGLLQQALGATRLHDLGYEYNTTIRFTGHILRSFSTFNQPFGFGFFVALSLLIGIPQVLTEPHRNRNKLFVLFLPIL